MQNWSPGTAADRYNSVTPPSELITKRYSTNGYLDYFLLFGDK